MGLILVNVQVHFHESKGRSGIYIYNSIEMDKIFMEVFQISDKSDEWYRIEFHGPSFCIINRSNIVLR